MSATPASKTPRTDAPSQSTREAITRLATMLGESLEAGWHIDDCRVSEIIDRAREQVPVKHEALKQRTALLAALEQSKKFAVWHNLGCRISAGYLPATERTCTCGFSEFDALRTAALTGAKGGDKHSSEWADVTNEEREAANESIRLALLDTDENHPDAAEIERMAETFEKP